MMYEQYFEALNGLHVENPALESIKNLFPHLTEKDVAKLLSLQKEGVHTFVAVPSLKVKGMAQIVLFEPEQYEKSTREVLPASIDWCGSTIEQKKEYLFFKEAIAYAQNNWGEKLVEPDWKEFFHFHLHDPSQLDIEGHSSCMEDVCFVTDKNLEELLSDTSKPTSKVLNDAIIEVTNSDLIASELKSKLQRNEFMICANDGSGLTYEHCDTCGYEYNDDNYREIWDLPLPKKIEDFLVNQGYQFQISPELARTQELKFFQSLSFARKIESIGSEFEKSMEEAYKNYWFKK